MRRSREAAGSDGFLIGTAVARNGWMAGAGRIIHCLGGGPVLLFGIAPPFAQQDQSGFALRWDAPADCPSADEVLAERDRLVGPRSTPPSEQWVVTATVIHEQAWRASLAMVSGSRAHTRTLSAQTCEGLAN